MTMRTRRLFSRSISLTAFCLSQVIAYGQCVGPAASPHPYIEYTPFAPIERYLARSITMLGLTDENTPAPFAWNSTPTGVPCFNNGTYSPSSCAGECNYQYCPANFNSDVQMLADLNASFVQYAASGWDRPQISDPSSSDYRAVQNTVTEINAAYDCRGLRRPIIQASVLEHLETGFICGTPGTPQCTQNWQQPGVGANSQVRNIEIPAYVISAFSDEFSTADQQYYLISGSPKPNVKFDFQRIAWKISDDTDWCPDITKQEGRMWIYYQAKCFLDAGYTALHMGQPAFWGRLVRGGCLQITSAEKVARMHDIALLMGRIRVYAQTRPNIPFVVLSAEPFGNGCPTQVVKFEDGIVNGKSRLIFDYNMTTMRPRETTPALDVRHQTANCNYPEIDPNFSSALPSCGNKLMATIDPCHGFNFIPDGGGQIPLNNRLYDDHTIYSVYFDHGPCVLANSWSQPNIPFPANTLYPGNEGVWRWDDSGWFTAALDANCRAEWMSYQLRNVRSFTNSKGFLTVPGRLFNSYFAGEKFGITDPLFLGVKDYRMASEPRVVNAIRTAWQVSVPVVTLEVVPCGGSTAWGTCKVKTGTTIDIFPKKMPLLKMVVTNPDVTSIYTWHIQGPNGWAVFTRGSSREFEPPVAGNYTIGLRQDNLGLPASTGGSRSYIVREDNITSSYVYVSQPQCCPNDYLVKTTQINSDYAGKTQGVTQAHRVSLRELSQAEAATLSAASARQSQQVSPKTTLLEMVEAFPVPSTNMLTVKLFSQAGGVLSITLTNVLDHVVLHSAGGLDIDAGHYQTDIDISSLTSGVYVATIKLGTDTKVLRVVKD